MRRLPHLLLLALPACVPAPEPREVPDLVDPRVEADAEGRCHGSAITPAVIRTQTVQEVATPEQRDATGTVLVPTTYRSVVRQTIEREREEVGFETPCPEDLTPELVSALQRALAVRGYYDGPVTGGMDAATGRAIQDFQRRDGPDSPVLSIETARRLGLVPLSPKQIRALSDG